MEFWEDWNSLTVQDCFLVAFSEHRSAAWGSDVYNDMKIVHVFLKVQYS